MRWGLKKQRKNNIMVVILLLCAIVLVISFLKRLRPAYEAQLAMYSNSMITEIVNNAVSEVYRDSEFNSLSGKGETAGIASIEADTAKINRLKSQLLLKIQEGIGEYQPKDIAIPVFSASGIEILSGMGPKINVKLSPAAVINSEFKESFDSTGINQVRHSIMLNISAEVMCRGFMFSQSENVKTEIPVIETVISGGIPQYYGSGYGIYGSTDNKTAQKENSADTFVN